MNCIRSFIDQALQHPERGALWDVREGATTFRQLYRYAAQTQTLVQSAGAKKGDYALIFGKPSASLYAAVIGLLGLGCTAIFIEPWLPLSEIEEIIAETQPKIYISDFLGKLWGLRSKAIRNIPVWISQHRVKRAADSQELAAIPVSEDQIGFLTFTSGTTGKSKGVVRTHGGLLHQCKILSKYVSDGGTSDLCVLPNFVFLNLSLGKSSCLISSDCQRDEMQKIPQDLQPSSVSCGPAFLKKLVEHADCFENLNAFHIGGALADLSLYEEGFKKWPHAAWTQVYGSSEAEPVAIADALEVVQKCRSRSLNQSLYLGHPVSEVASAFDENLLWVSGAHISPFYFGNHAANATQKRQDGGGKLWHHMGDRIRVDEEGWWYQGRASQPHSEFLLEQEISAFLQTSDLFIAHRTILFGTGVKSHRDALLRRFPTLTDVMECKVYRDRRHRARIDREKSLRRSRWAAFVLRRFHLIPQMILIAGMALIATPHQHSLPTVGSVFLGLILFFFLLRAMDEYKDYGKDCIAHPNRPLPQGLISLQEMKRLIHACLISMIGYSLVLSGALSLTAGCMYLLATMYSFAMFHEFHLKRFLAKRPLIYALSHQLIIVPLAAFLIAARGDTPIFSPDTLWMSAVLFGGFFAYEICRKLDPEAHPILKTYPQIYGNIKTAILASAAVCIPAAAGYFLGIGRILWPTASLLLAALLSYCIRPTKFKVVETISALNLLACVYALAIRSLALS